MALLDVSDVLDDPDFAEFTGLTCRRFTATVDDHGTAQATSADTPFAGVVTQNSGRDLVRKDDGSVISGAITIHTTFPLTEGQGTGRADEVQWLGRWYTVMNVADWSNYGAGFVCATAVRKALG